VTSTPRAAQSSGYGNRTGARPRDLYVPGRHQPLLTQLERTPRRRTGRRSAMLAVLGSFSKPNQWMVGFTR